MACLFKTCVRKQRAFYLVLSLNNLPHNNIGSLVSRIVVVFVNEHLTIRGTDCPGQLTEKKLLTGKVFSVNHWATNLF